MTGSLLGRIGLVITAAFSMCCGLGAKADQLINTNNDKASAKKVRFSIGYLSIGYVVTIMDRMRTSRTRDDNSIVCALPYSCPGGGRSWQWLVLRIPNSWAKTGRCKARLSGYTSGIA